MAQRPRHEYIGSSDVATIMGLNPWATRSDLYNAKVNKIWKESSESMMWGTLLEPVIIREFLRRKGITFGWIEQCYQTHPNFDFIGGTADAIIGHEDGDILIEVKTTNEFSHRKWQQEIPMHYQMQCQFLMGQHECVKTYIPVLVAGQKLREYELSYDHNVYLDIIDASVKFWREHILTRTPPEDF